MDSFWLVRFWSVRLQMANGFHNIYEVLAEVFQRLQNQRNKIYSLSVTILTMGSQLPFFCGAQGMYRSNEGTLQNEQMHGGYDHDIESCRAVSWPVR